MKVQRIQTSTPVRKTRAKKNPTGTLSNDAFYLIALALLLKKDNSGVPVSHYLFPKQVAPTGRTAA